MKISRFISSVLVATIMLGIIAAGAKSQPEPTPPPSEAQDWTAVVVAEGIHHP